MNVLSRFLESSLNSLYNNLRNTTELILQYHYCLLKCWFWFCAHDNCRIGNLVQSSAKIWTARNTVFV